MFCTSIEIPDDFIEAYQIYLEKEVRELPIYFLSLSDLDVAYTYAIVKVSDFRPAFRTLKLPDNLYKYIPDQRTITVRLIGKPSSGPSPPVIILRPLKC